MAQQVSTARPSPKMGAFSPLAMLTSHYSAVPEGELLGHSGKAGRNLGLPQARSRPKPHCPPCRATYSLLWSEKALPLTLLSI